MEKIVVLLLVIDTLIHITLSQSNRGPRFLELATDGIDGNLKDRLQRVGIDENQPEGVYLGRLQATDPDSQILTYYSDTGQGSPVKVNETSGDVFTLEPLNYELSGSGQTTNDVSVTFRVRDNAGNEASTTYKITVNDVNDQTPVFTTNILKFNIPESAPVGTTVFSVTVVDADSPKYNNFNVTCVHNSGTEKVSCDLFQIKNVGIDSGKNRIDIITKTPIDFETIQFSSNVLTLEASDGQLKSRINVLYDILDTQDTPPVFDFLPYGFHVYENTPIGTSVFAIIAAHDGDTGSPNPVVITLDETNLPSALRGLFTLNNTFLMPSKISYQAPLIVAGNIDRENLTSYLPTINLNVVATERNPNGTMGAMTMTKAAITILDVNDNGPSFDKSNYIVYVPEQDKSVSSSDIVPGFSFFIMDPDGATFNEYNVMISEQTYNGTFSLDTNSGIGTATFYLKILRNDLMNYDVPSYRTQIIKIEAFDAHNSTLRSSATVTISLTDVNDNEPEFSSPLVKVTVREDALVGDRLIVLTATDKDSGLNGQIEYQLKGTGSNKFRVDPVTGTITVAEQLNYEDTPFYTLIFIAKDKGIPSLEKSITLNIEVLNTNDLGPVFASTYQTVVTESSTTLLIPVTVQAYDQESGYNVTYQIVAGNPSPPAFLMDVRSGNLSMIRNVSFDETPNKTGYFELTVRATDSDIPAQFTDTKIIVQVRDENNNYPVFTSQVYRATINETALEGTSILTVRATDADSGSNGQVLYYIRAGSQGHFVIDSINGVIKVSSKAQLDYDVKNMYEILIVAQDQGNPVLSSTATAIVNLIDSNNKPPVFNVSVYLFQISDDSVIGSSVGKVLATDVDSNSLLNFDILQSTIQAKDQSGNDVTSSVNFDARNAFVIGQTDGVIRTNRLLSRELAENVNFKVRTTDVRGVSGIQTATASVIITILGVLDPRPYFASPWTRNNPVYSLSRPENPTVNWTLTPLYATDPEKIAPVTFFDEVPGSDPFNYFQVEGNVVRVIKPIDYEVVKNLSLAVVAYSSNKASSATATIILEILDINDNAPEFPEKSYVFFVSENLRNPEEIGSIYARDNDSGSYAEMVFSLSGAESETFVVFTLNARQYVIFQAYLTVSQGFRLDFETRTQYNLILTATDNPRAQLSNEKLQTSVPVTIYIIDENDNIPIFKQTSYEFSVVESYLADQNAGVVIADDLDRGDNGLVSYFMANQNEPALEWFGVRTAVQGDFRVGQIYTRKALTGAASNSPYIMHIVAQDNGRTITQSSTVLVTISVTTGILDKRPAWDGFMPTAVTIPENQPIGREVARAKAYPRIANSTIIYSFLTNGALGGDFTKFNIDRNTGVISVAQLLDREVQAVYDLIVVATDSQNSTYSNSRLLTVTLSDINDNNPSYTSCPNRVYRVPERVNISEDIKTRTFIFQAKACDPDLIENEVIYEFYTPASDPLCLSSYTHMFTLDQTNGNITTNMPLDRETQDQYLLCIEAKPKVSAVIGRRRRAINETAIRLRKNSDTVLYLLITLLDVNDNGPVFTDKSLSAVIFENPEPTVIAVEATDHDLYPNNRVRYSIQSITFMKNLISSSSNGAFNINPDTGIITVGYSFYRDFYGGYFEITVRADDYFGNKNPYDAVQVKVYIAHDNDLVRVVFNEIAGEDVTKKVSNMIRELNSVELGITYKVETISYHNRGSNQDPDFSRTDVCMVIINDGIVMDSVSGSKKLSSNKQMQIVSKYGAMEPGPCEQANSNYPEGWRAYWWVLVAFAIFIFIVTVLLIILICCLYSNYKKYMDTRKTYMVEPVM
ncbi:hypothetical protein CHS0354_025528 [Potamilus streckersoni]|uniref:Cadherin domain-containing protein n=1 Tax=Potamilus streckersoni TaxID=2493646 RepID=A0AAE0SKN8_9BIVA|nr:hypothetical protein CHS0354_025528 [Potamilus streckersoni]